MSTKTKKKLCWNCEGNVSMEDPTCPYCGVSLDISPIVGTEPKNERFTSPFKTTAQPIIPSAPYPPKADEQAPENTEEEPSPSVRSEQSTTELQQLLLTLLSLLLGTVLIIFGFILLVFSDKHGIFTLQWHGSYWFIYVLFGAPLVYYGWRAVSKLGDEQEE